MAGRGRSRTLPIVPGAMPGWEECLMHTPHIRVSPRVERPRYVWLAVALEIFTAVLAIPVGLMFLSDPSGAVLGLPRG
jgi:hypothetical protein